MHNLETHTGVVLTPAKRLLLPMVAAALLTTGCNAADEPQTRSEASIYNVQGGPNATELSLQIGSCSSTAALVEVEETSSEVRLRARTTSDVDGDCGDGAEVALNQPLGDRVVIDASTGEQITVLNLYGLERGRLYAVAVEPGLLVDQGKAKRLTAMLGVSQLGCATFGRTLLIAPTGSKTLDDNRLTVPRLGSWSVGDEVMATVYRTVVTLTERSTNALRGCVAEGETRTAVIILTRGQRGTG